MDTKETALAYLDLNWSLIPVEPRGKKPLIPWTEFQTHPAARKAVGEWWDRWGDANIGVVTGAVSGLLVLDIDGPEGLASVKDKTMPLTATNETQKGYHYLFKHPGGEVKNAVRIAPGLDIMADGGAIVGTPSHHSCGHTYASAHSP